MTDRSQIRRFAVVQVWIGLLVALFPLIGWMLGGTWRYSVLGIIVGGTLVVLAVARPARRRKAHE